MMTPERWQKVKRVLQVALELASEKRPAFLDRACSNDHSLRSEVESLLEVLARTEGLKGSSSPIYSVQAKPMSPIVSDGTTLDLVTNYDRSMGDVGRLDFRFVRRSGAAQSLEIRDLLRRRLQIIVVIALAANGFLNAVRFVRLEKPLFTQGNIWHVWMPGAFNLGILVVLTVVLWRKRIYTLLQLRWLETLAFGVAALYFLGETYFPLFEYPAGYFLLYAQRYPREIIILAREPSILWMVLIIAYGTFIPNTGRRCAVITIAMALSALCAVTLGGLLHPAIPKHLLLLFLSDMTLWLGCAVAMAIYGSHKITTLRQEALAARKLGQYDLKERLGVGGMGEVYLAEHALLKRPCAVKVIRPDQTNNPATLKRFLREVQVTTTLTHPNTIQIFDYGQTDDGTVFYAMEYLPGLNLEKLVGQYGPLPARRVIYVLSAVHLPKHTPSDSFTATSNRVM